MNKTTSSQKRAVRFFLIAIAALLLGSVLNWGVVSGWGNVKVTRITIIGDDGCEYSALSYIPKTATNETPAPALLTIHGGSSNARNNESWSLEFARRGYVVIAVDNFGGGDSEYVSAYGPNAVPEMFYNLLQSMDIVDNDQIITNGHSWGNDAAYNLGVKYNARAVLISSGNGSTVSGEYTGNMLQVFGGVENVDTVENNTANAVAAFSASFPELTVDNIEVGKIYGSFEEGNAKQLMISPKQVHEGAMVHTDTTAALLDFAQKATTAPNYIDANDQVWYWKDVAGQLGIIAFVAFLLSMANLLMTCVPFFAGIVQPLPRNIGLRGVGMTISIVAGLLFPVISLYTGGLGLKKLIGISGNSVLNKIFSMRAGNFPFFAFAGIALLGIVMFFVYHFTEGKKQHAKLCDYGLTSAESTHLDWCLIGKSALLAAVVITIGWTYINAQTHVLGTDFYCLYWGVKDIVAVKFVHYIPYIIMYCLFFIAASLGLNVERRLPSTGKYGLDFFLQTIFNMFMASAAIAAVILIQNAMQHAMDGGGSAALASFGIEIVRIWGMPVGMLAAGAGQTYLFRKSGSVYPGAFVMGTYCALTCVLYAQTRM